jgi:hypothetical protein
MMKNKDAIIYGEPLFEKDPDFSVYSAMREYVRGLKEKQEREEREKQKTYSEPSQFERMQQNTPKRP